MYTRDVELIKELTDTNQSVVPVGLFVLLTIQAGLSTVKGQIAKVKTDGLDANCLWGEKANGLKYLQENDAYLYGKVKHIAETKGYNSIEACADAIELFLKVPNLGMVKAAFVAQCLGFNVACIDSHNLKRLGLSANAVKLNMKAKPTTIRKKIEAYVSMTQEQGSQYWWNSWCEYVAGNRANKALDTGDIVSKYHVECVELI